jgi:hypothetical protein
MPSSLKTRLVLLNFFPIQSSLHIPFPFLSRQAALQYTNVPAETDTVRSLTHRVRLFLQQSESMRRASGKLSGRRSESLLRYVSAFAVGSD